MRDDLLDQVGAEPAPLRQGAAALVEAATTIHVTAPGVGHLGHCASYATCRGSGAAPCEGPCAAQASTASHASLGSGVSGAELRRWAVGAVASMTTASRETDRAVCRDWFYELG